MRAAAHPAERIDITMESVDLRAQCRRFAAARDDPEARRDPTGLTQGSVKVGEPPRAMDSPNKRDALAISHAVMLLDLTQSWRKSLIRSGADPA